MLSNEEHQEDPAPYTILCPSDITINSSQPQCQTDLINYGTSSNPNSLSQHTQHQISLIFDHPYNAIIRGCKFDIQPVAVQKRAIQRIKSQQKCTAYLKIIVSILIAALSIYILIEIQPLKDIAYYLCLILVIIGIISTFILLKLAHNSCFLETEALWNQIHEIQLFRFDAAYNSIHFLVWTYNYGIYPNVHEPIIRNTQNTIICNIDKLIRITKKVNDENERSWIEIHFKNDVDQLQIYRYTFASKKHWRKLKNRPSFENKQPNVMDTYNAIKLCLNQLKPGWDIKK